MADTLEIVLDELSDLVSDVAKLLGSGPASVAANVTSLVFRSASGIVRVVSASELEKVRQAREQGTAAGQAAYSASKQDFRKRCLVCRVDEATCLRNRQPFGFTCCPQCTHDKR